ncbi:hypothetical protein [Rhabdothermincola salaria]|nr:hypothetical protein [Rhabdothermincola salaria]MCD9623093.1 hypothetical protein [Rhabdothermincola salaria]
MPIILVMSSYPGQCPGGAAADLTGADIGSPPHHERVITLRPSRRERTGS